MKTISEEGEEKQNPPHADYGDGRGGAPGFADPVPQADVLPAYRGVVHYCSANKQKLFGIGIRCLKPRRIKGSGSCTFENQLLVCCRMNKDHLTFHAKDKAGWVVCVTHPAYSVARQGLRGHSPNRSGSKPERLRN